MISAILNVGQKVDQDWALHIQDNQGSHHRVCKVAIIKFSSTWMVAWLMENNFQLFSGDLGPWGDGLVWVRQTQPRQVGCFYEENRKSILFPSFSPFLGKESFMKIFPIFLSGRNVPRWKITQQLSQKDSWGWQSNSKTFQDRSLEFYFDKYVFNQDGWLIFLNYQDGSLQGRVLWQPIPPLSSKRPLVPRSLSIKVEK